PSISTLFPYTTLFRSKHKAGSQRRPHHLSLPGSGIFLHVTFSTPDLERSLRRIRFFGQIFANRLLGSLDLVRDLFVFWIERQCRSEEHTSELQSRVDL